MKFEIQLRQTRVDYQYVEVEAPNEKTARRRALALAKRQPDAWCDGDVVGVEITLVREVGS